VAVIVNGSFISWRCVLGAGQRSLSTCDLGLAGGWRGAGGLEGGRRLGTGLRATGRGKGAGVKALQEENPW